MGEIGFGFQTNRSPDYTIGNGNAGTQGTEGGKDVNGTGRDWTTLFGGKSVTLGELEQVVSFVLTNPELAPSANLTPQERNEAYDSILTKLNRALGGEDGNQSVMFDIYAMMDLIQEMSQKLRNALRDLRKLENTTIYTNIRAQAEIQREAAIVGAVAGAVMCAIQVGVVFVGLGTQFKGATSASKTVGKGAMNSAVTQENMLKTLKMTEAENPAGFTTKGRMQTTLRNDALNVNEARGNYKAAVNDYMRAKETVANGGKIPGGKLNELKSNMETARTAYDEARTTQANHLKSGLENNSISKADFDKAMDDMSEGVEELRDISKNANAPLNTVDGQKNMMKGMVISQVGIALGQFLSQLAGSIREVISSKATELQAEQKLTEEQFDQIKDLFSLVQSVIQKSIDVFASVVQKESSVIEGILQHV